MGFTRAVRYASWDKNAAEVVVMEEAAVMVISRLSLVEASILIQSVSDVNTTWSPY
jgi:hypothetical protein